MQDKEQIQKSIDGQVILSTWCWYALIMFVPACVVFAMLYEEILELERAEGTIFYLAILRCGGVCILYAFTRLFYRIKIDECGVTCQSLVAKRFFPWGNIRHVIISARLHSGHRWVQTVTFSTRILSDKAKNRIGNFHSRKWLLVVDLADERLSATKEFPYIDKNRFLAFVKTKGIVLEYTKIAENAGKKSANSIWL